MSTSVRAACLADAPAIARTHVKAWQVAYRGIMPAETLARLSIDERQESWRAQIEDGGPQTTLVVELDDEVIGFAGLGPTRDKDLAPTVVSELYAIYVDPDHWGQGFGYPLWRAALDEASSHGFSEISLWVLERNERARRFYDRQGFSADPGVTKEWTRAGVTLEEVRYRGETGRDRGSFADW